MAEITGGADAIDQYMERKFGLIGKSPSMREAKEKLIQSAPTDLSVLITGETGTGKEVFAKAIHGLSKRKNNAFVSVNCGAIPESLLESELFGHEKGAFTGADGRRLGFFETADKGTIFLDEVGEMPINLQVKLLRILESGEFSRLGSSDVRKVDVRVVTATNRDLNQEVFNQRFRQDLYFRLKNVHIILPPLREHPEDIELLFEYFAKKATKKIGIEYEGIHPDALRVLQNQPWQGNIRELKNMVDTIISMENTSYITPSILRNHVTPSLPAYEYTDIPADKTLVPVGKGYGRTNPGGFGDEMGLMFKTLLQMQHEISDVKREVIHISDSIERMEDKGNEIRDEKKKREDFDTILGNMDFQTAERYMIELSLKNNGGNRRKAADALGISARTLYRKIADYDIEY
ncbi:MAG: sigma-54 dependent transcriptional regulator [Candidatus Kapaibacteriales bacterium]